MRNETLKNKERKDAYLKAKKELEESIIVDKHALMDKIRKEIDKFEKGLSDECDAYNIAYGEGILKGLNTALYIIEESQ